MPTDNNVNNIPDVEASGRILYNDSHIFNITSTALIFSFHRIIEANNINCLGSETGEHLILKIIYKITDWQYSR